MTADEFNAAHPIGTLVLAFPGSRDGRALYTRTRTPAWNLSGHPVVSVEGYPGGIALTHIETPEGAPSTDDAMREDHVQDRARPDAARRQWDAWLAEHDARIRTAAAREALDGLSVYAQHRGDVALTGRAMDEWNMAGLAALDYRDTHYPEPFTWTEEEDKRRLQSIADGAADHYPEDVTP